MNDTLRNGYLKALGARVLSEANDLKRTPEALARELGLSQERVNQVISGEATESDARSLIDRMTQHYPINLADVWVEPDDTDDGLLIVTDKQSKATSRIFERTARDGGLTPYYEYRDTAMSRLGPFKPEWIQPLRIVTDSDPENPDVAYNKGHLLHQFTFFIGEVNFYWEVDGKKYCAEMNTGDSNYITPFVPHSFTSRNPDALGLIIAVTFAGSMRRAIDEFSRIGGPASDRLAGNLRDTGNAFRAKLNRHMAAESMSASVLRARAAAAGLTENRIDEILSGGVTPTVDELDVLAASLNVRAQDLMVSPLAAGEEVVLAYADCEDQRSWPDTNSPACRLAELARTRHQPGLKGFGVEVLAEQDPGDDASFVHGLFGYIYNHGSDPVRLHWQDGRMATLEPGGSAAVRPMVPHRFSRAPDTAGGRCFVVRVPGHLEDQALDEYARFAPAGRQRATGETTRWF